MLLKAGRYRRHSAGHTTFIAAVAFVLGLYTLWVWAELSLRLVLEQNHLPARFQETSPQWYRGLTGV
jgi:hypothetical protein